MIPVEACSTTAQKAEHHSGLSIVKPFGIITPHPYSHSHEPNPSGIESSLNNLHLSTISKEQAKSLDAHITQGELNTALN